MRDFSCLVLSYPVLSFQVCSYSSLLRVMEGMNVAMASGWMRSLKLNDAADMCIAHGIDGFVLLALLDEKGTKEEGKIQRQARKGTAGKENQYLRLR